MNNPVAQSHLLRRLREQGAPKHPNFLRATGAFVWRSARKMLGALHYIAIDVVIFPVVFLLIFTYLLGGAISGSTGNYLQFLLPGMLIYTVTSMTVYIGISIKTDQERGVFNRFRTLPFWQPAAIVGSMLMNIASFAAALATTIAVGLLLGFRPEAGVPGAILALLLAVLYAFSISWIFACIGVVAKKTESITTMSYLVIYPLMFTSNVFADTSTMPDWLGSIVAWNPVSLASTAARGLMHGNGAPSELWSALGGMFVCTLIFMPLTFKLYRNKTKR